MEVKVIHREFVYLSSLGVVFLSEQHENVKNYLNCGELSWECSSLFVHTISSEAFKTAARPGNGVKTITRPSRTCFRHAGSKPWLQNSQWDVKSNFKENYLCQHWLKTAAVDDGTFRLALKHERTTICSSSSIFAPNVTCERPRQLQKY